MEWQVECSFTSWCKETDWHWMTVKWEGGFWRDLKYPPLGNQCCFQWYLWNIQASFYFQRFGSALVPWGSLQLKNKQYAKDFRPIDENCACPTCQRFVCLGWNRFLKKQKWQKRALIYPGKIKFRPSFSQKPSFTQHIIFISYMRFLRPIHLIQWCEDKMWWHHTKWDKNAIKRLI